MSAILINVVLDLETLSTASNAAIIQIGAVVPQFDWVHIQGANREFEASVRYEDCQKEIRAGVVTQDNSTMLWWEKQPTRTEVFSGQLDYTEALEKFTDWIKSFKVSVAIWGNGADFDNVILKHSLDSYGFHSVWNYHGNRCFRTLKNIFPPDLPDGKLPYEVSHTALGDARYEARILDYIVRTNNIRSLL